jgi:hypothetical protein
MKVLLKRIIGFLEFIIGFAVPIFTISSAFFNPKYTFKWQYLIALPIYYGFIKYGWRWMFNIVDITEEKLLNQDDKYYKNAKINAQLNLELFLSYLYKGTFECYALFPLSFKNKSNKRIWKKVEYYNNESVNILPENISSTKTNSNDSNIVSINEIDDWYVKKDDMFVGFYSVKALSEKVLNNGQTLNKKSKYFLNKIIT